MPIRKGSATFARFAVAWGADRPKEPKGAVVSALKKHPFEPLDPEDETDHSEGFVEFEDHDSVEFRGGSIVYGEHALVAFRRDRLRVPAPLLRRELDRFAKEFEAKRKRTPSRPELAEQRELLIRQLKKKLVPSTRITELSYNLKTDRVFIYSGARREIEHLQGLLMDALGVELVEQDAAYLARSAKASAIRPTAALFGREIATSHEEEA